MCYVEHKAESLYVFIENDTYQMVNLMFNLRHQMVRNTKSSFSFEAKP